MDLRKLTKKGRQAARDEKERLARLDATIVALARLSVEDSLVYEYTHARDQWESDWYKRHAGIRDKTEAMLVNRFIQFGGRVFSVSIRGCGYDKTNYDLDDAAKERFGDSVQCDSESGGLFIDCTPDVQEDLLAMLNELDPKGDFGAEDMIEERRRMEEAGEDTAILPRLAIDAPFGNWNSAKKFLDSRGITVTVDFSDAPGVSEQQLETAQETLETAVALFKPELDEAEVQALSGEMKIFMESVKLKKLKTKKK